MDPKPPETNPTSPSSGTPPAPDQSNQGTPINPPATTPTNAPLTQTPPSQPPTPEQPAAKTVSVQNEPTQSSPGSPPPPPVPPTVMLTKLLNNKKLLYIVGGVLLFILLLTSLVLMFSGSDQKKVTTAPTPKAKTEPKKQITSHSDDSQTIVYGAWTSQQSVIRTINTKTSQSSTVLSLPLTVKKVGVLSPNSLLYIDNIDSDEYGTRISVYDLQKKQITINIPSENGLKITDYVLSPNKKYLAIWEVSNNTDTGSLQGGKSGVYTVDLTRPTLTNKLFREPIDKTPVHYPRAILNDGTVFTDTYLPTGYPNDPGFENGLSKIDFDGTNQKDIGTAAAGTYSSQPVLGTDEKYLLFAGYDGSSGDGTATRSGGIRQALISPNTIELLNTQSLQRFKLPNLPSGSIYTAPQWDTVTDNPILTVLSSTSTQRGYYVYDLAKQSLTRLPITYPGSTFIALLPKDKTLIGTQSTDSANIGNLGPTKTYAFTQLAVIDATGEPQYLSSEDPYMQYITTLPGNYFSSQ